MDKVVTLSVILTLVGRVICGYVVARLGWREACWVKVAAVPVGGGGAEILMHVDRLCCYG